MWIIFQIIRIILIIRLINKIIRIIWSMHIIFIILRIKILISKRWCLKCVISLHYISRDHPSAQEVTYRVWQPSTAPFWQSLKAPEKAAVQRHLNTCRVSSWDYWQLRCLVFVVSVINDRKDKTLHANKKESVCNHDCYVDYLHYSDYVDYFSDYTDYTDYTFDK